MNVRAKLGLFGLLLVGIVIAFVEVNAETKQPQQLGCRNIEDHIKRTFLV